MVYHTTEMSGKEVNGAVSEFLEGIWFVNCYF